MSENGEIYIAGKNFTLPPALTALTNFTSVALILASWWNRRKGKHMFTSTIEITADKRVVENIKAVTKHL